MKDKIVKIKNFLKVNNFILVRLIRDLYKFLRDCVIELKFRFAKKNRTVIASSFDGKIYGDNPAIILDKIHELDPKIQLIWLTSKEYECPPYIDKLPFDYSKKMWKAITSASVIIVNNIHFEKYKYLATTKKQLRIQTWHGGLGIKKIGLDAMQVSDYFKKMKDNFYDFYLSNSKHLTDVFRSAFSYQGLVWRCGFPIEDVLYEDNDEKIYYRNFFHLEKNVKTILYAPTFRNMYEWECGLNISKIVAAFERKFGGKWIFAVHWHPHAKYMINPSGIVDMTSCNDMQGLVKACDAFISDYSSSIFQAVQIGKPCYIYADDYEEYRMDRDMYYTFDELPFPYAFTNDQLIENIENYDELLWSKRWKAFQKRMGHVVTGCSAETVARVCVDFINGKSKEDIMKEIPFEKI